MATFSRIEPTTGGFVEVVYIESSRTLLRPAVVVLEPVLRAALSSAFLHPTVMLATTPNGMKEALLAQSRSITEQVVTNFLNLNVLNPLLPG